MRKIPLKIVNNSNRYYKTNDDHNAILLQACFDNPIFQEEGNKFQNDEHVVQKDKNIGYEYSYNGGPGRQTEVHFRKIDQRQKNARIFASIVIAILLIALVITLIVVLSSKYTTNTHIFFSFVFVLYICFVHVSILHSKLFLLKWFCRIISNDISLIKSN